MKRHIVLGVVLLIGSMLFAQKFAFVDIEFVLNKVPAYESAQDQLDQVSQKWQQEVDSKMEEVKILYKNYQNDIVFLSAEMKVKRENEIVTKEDEAKALRKTYFGTEGELFKKRESLMKPIQDEVYNAVREVAEESGYAVIYDKSSQVNVIYASSALDVSEKVVQKLGYEE